MSQLFDALQKLEEKNALQTQPPPPLSSREEEKSIPYLRPALLTLLLFLFALVCLVVLWFQPNITPPTGILQKNGEQLEENMVGITSEGSSQEEEKQTDIPTENRVTDPVLLIPPQTIKKMAHSSAHPPQQLPEAPSPEHLKKAENKPEKPISVHDESPLSPTIEDSAYTREMENNKRQVERKRLTYRAEKQRIQGNLEQALKLYIQAWKKDNNAGVANNIAAILIGKKEYALAEEYLRKALEKAPLDKDLLYNLEIITAEKNQQ